MLYASDIAWVMSCAQSNFLVKIFSPSEFCPCDITSNNKKFWIYKKSAQDMKHLSHRDMSYASDTTWVMSCVESNFLVKIFSPSKSCPCFISPSNKNFWVYNKSTPDLKHLCYHDAPQHVWDIAWLMSCAKFNFFVKIFSPSKLSAFDITSRNKIFWIYRKFSQDQKHQDHHYAICFWCCSSDVLCWTKFFCQNF